MSGSGCSSGGTPSPYLTGAFVTVGPTAPTDHFPTPVQTTFQPVTNGNPVLITERQEFSTIEVKVGTEIVIHLDKIDGQGWSLPGIISPGGVLGVVNQSSVDRGVLDTEVKALKIGTGSVSAILACSGGTCPVWIVHVMVVR